MDENEEIAAKRRKLEAHYTGLKAVLSDELTQDVRLTTAVVSTIEKKQQISKLLAELGPLPAKLHHLKRIHQNCILLCRESDLDGLPLEDYLKCHAPLLTPSTIQQICSDTHLVQVPEAAVKLRWQYEAVKQRWPCKFHPDKYAEHLYNDASHIGLAERMFHARMARLLHLLSEENASPFGICVDPRTQSVVAMANSRTSVNPMMHCAMVLVDEVARTQSGGAWSHADAKHTTMGVSKRIHDFVSSLSEFTDLQFGFETLNSVENDTKATGNDNLTKYGPYLCTGYDIYLSEEPCLMCAMALVHSRAKRIFFLRQSANGALLTCFKLHTVRELNHHYEVFQYIST